MLVACWSPKGGSGTTVVSTALSLVLARTAPDGALLADLAGDVPAVLGVPEPAGPGIGDWLAAEADVADDALSRLEVEVAPGLRLLPAGVPGAVADGRGEALAVALAAGPRPVVADCGAAASGPALAVAAGADVSLLVLRPCYLALRRALAAPLRPSGVVLVCEPGRALDARDVEDVLGVPVRARVECEPGVARAVDAGLLASRLPTRLAKALRSAA